MTSEPENGDSSDDSSQKNLSGAFHPGRPEPPLDPPAGNGAQSDQKQGSSTVAFRPVTPEVRSKRYVAKRFHARGGMGEVWLADDDEIGREVALKRLRTERVREKERFLAEAQIQGQLEHPGIVPVHDLGTDTEGHPFYIMKFVRGRTLKEAIADYHAPDQAAGAPRKVELHRLLATFVNLCQAVAYAHSRGVIHRDLKPDNVMLGPYGETLVLDWGLAKVVGSPERTGDSSYVHLSYSGGSVDTEAGAVIGAPSYMAPELAEGKAADADEKTDVYLLGSTLYAILTGGPPRQGASRDEIIELARTVAPVPPRQRNRHVGRALEAVCLKAMALRKQDRYPTALAVAEDIQRYMAGDPVSAYRESLLERAGRWARRHQTLIGRTAAAVLVIGLALFGLVKLREAEESRQEARIESDRLKKQERDRIDLAEFHRLAEEMQFYAIMGNPAAELAADKASAAEIPGAGVDARAAETVARQALDVAGKWGPELEHLPRGERREVGNELYDLLLTVVQLKSRQLAGPKPASEMLTLLDRARLLGEPSRSFYRLRAQGNHFRGDEKAKAADEKRAGDRRTRVTALDHYLLGEQHLAEANRLATLPDPNILVADRAKIAEAIQRAVAEFRRALRSSPNHYWSRFELGLCYLRLGHSAEAFEALDACVARRPRFAGGYSARGRALLALKRNKQAHQDLDEAVGRELDSGPARLNRGLVYRWEKKYDKALKDFTAVLDSPQGNKLIEAAYYRGLVYLDRKDYPRALQDFKRVVEEDPRAAEDKPLIRLGYLARARVYFANNQAAEGLKDLTTFIRLARLPRFDPEGAEAYGQRGRLLAAIARAQEAGKARTKTLDLAQEQLRKALDLDRKSAKRFDDLGLVYDTLGESRKAAEAYSGALKLIPNNVRVLNKRGWDYIFLNDHGKAEKDFAKAIALDPKNAEAHSGLGYALAHSLKTAAEARRAAAQALLHAQGSHKYLVIHNVACIYAELSRLDKKRRVEYEDLTITHLRRAVALWNAQGGIVDEIKAIGKEKEGFPASLKDRPEFVELIKGT